MASANLFGVFRSLSTASSAMQALIHQNIPTRSLNVLAHAAAQPARRCSNQKGESVLIQGPCGSAICARKNNFGQVLSQRSKKSLCLCVGPVIQNLTEIAQTIYSRHKHPKAPALPDLLANPC